MNNKDIVKILRCCNASISCTNCPAADACEKLKREKGGYVHFHVIVADRMERMEKQLQRLKAEKGAFIRYCARKWPCELCLHRHFEGGRCPLRSLNKDGRCVNWTYDSSFAESEGAGNGK